VSNEVRSAGPLEFAPVPEGSGLFVVFDGIDGAGKSTLVEGVLRLLREQGHEAVPTRSPPRRSVERPLYLRYMHDPSARPDIDYRGLVAVLMGDRLQHAHDTIVPALEAGTSVVCDRYVYSAAAHFVARGFPDEVWFTELCRHLPRPSAAFHASAPLDVVLARVTSRGNSSEAFVEPGFFAALHDAYATIAERNSMISIDTNQPVDRALARVAAELDQVGIR
jgi:dTMP kinase